MPDHMDFDLRPTDAAGEPVELVRPERQTIPVIVIGFLVFGVGLAIYFIFGRTAAPGDQAAAPQVVQPKATAPLGGAADPIEVPALDESDSLVRELVGKLSSHPGVAAWLATDGLVRNFTVVVANIAEGGTPAGHLRSLAPSGSFRIIERNEEQFIDPRSYARYDRIADAVASIDAAGSARLYSTLKPRIEEAYSDLGLKEASFDRALERAIVSLLATPIPDGPVDVTPRGIVYGYADPDIESATAAQKHLLRMGPRNARMIQQKLREIALALGIAAERLPAPR
jgi:Protein of unknown function (DUF3014)